MSNSVSPAEFFEQELPEILRAHAESDAEGRLTFDIIGVGAWTVDLGARTVIPGAQPGVGFAIHLREGDFFALLSGELDANEALKNGRMQARGNVALLAALGVLLDD
jgi:SCP-2 sterol transfer family